MLLDSVLQQRVVRALVQLEWVQLPIVLDRLPLQRLRLDVQELR